MIKKFALICIFIGLSFASNNKDNCDEILHKLKSTYGHCDFNSAQLNGLFIQNQDKEILNDETQSAKTSSCLKYDLCSDGEMCIDDDNSKNSFRCDCKDGYERVAEVNRCEDIDECRLNKHNCTVSEICRNDIGSFRCEKACLDGYKAVFKYSRYAEEIQCIDIDECEESCGGADKLCTNLQGSYRCEPIKCPKNFVKYPKNNCYRHCHGGQHCDKIRETHFFVVVNSKSKTIEPIKIVNKIEKYEKIKLHDYNDGVYELKEIPRGGEIIIKKVPKNDTILKVDVEIRHWKGKHIGSGTFFYHLYVENHH